MIALLAGCNDSSESTDGSESTDDAEPGDDSDSTEDAGSGSTDDAANELDLREANVVDVS